MIQGLPSWFVARAPLLFFAGRLAAVRAANPNRRRGNTDVVIAWFGVGSAANNSLKTLWHSASID